jgi:long-chain acyl-CoA synthetase
MSASREPLATLPSIAEAWAVSQPAAPAWYLPDQGRWRPVSWWELWQAAQHLANRLQAEGLSVGDRLMHGLPNGLAWALIDLACHRLGVVTVPLAPGTPQRLLEHCRQRVQPRLVVERVAPWFEAGSADEDDSAIVDWCRHQPPYQRSPTSSNPPRVVARSTAMTPSLDNLATILFTSGTTGEPRGVMLSHRNLVHNAFAKLEAVPQTQYDRRLNILPLAHAYARTCELSTWVISGSSMLCLASLETLPAVAASWEPTLMNMVPYQLEKIRRDILEHAGQDRLQQRQRFEFWFGKQLRWLAAGGASLVPEIYNFYERLGYPIIQGYGLTEASPVVCSNLAASPCSNGVGYPIRDTKLKLDQDQRLFVRGPGVMLGYWEDPAATAERLHDGWLDTGDRAILNSEGFVRILGRCDDRIVLSTGYKVDPLPIEQRLIQVPGLQQVMLLGHGRNFLTAIAVSPTRNQAELLAEFRERLQGFPQHCLPKRLLLLRQPWEAGGGLLNAKGGLRRQAILERYAAAIADLYAGSFGREEQTLQPGQPPQQQRPPDQPRDDVQQ